MATFDKKKTEIGGKFLFLIIAKLVIVWFVYVEQINNEEMLQKFSEPPGSVEIVVIRFFCAVVLHMQLVPGINQGLLLMKYA